MVISHCYWYLVVKNDNFTLLLRWSGQQWQFHIPTDIQWWRMAISHCYWHLLVRNGNFTLLLKSSGQIWQMNLLHLMDLPVLVERYLEYQYKKRTRWTYFGWWNPHMLNSNFILLLTSSGQEWQFHIATDIHWSGMGIPHWYWHPLVKNGNFTLLMTLSGQQRQLHIPTDIQWSRMVISHCYWHPLVKNGNFTLLLTSSGQEWQFHNAADL